MAPYNCHQPGNGCHLNTVISIFISIYVDTTLQEMQLKAGEIGSPFGVNENVVWVSRVTDLNRTIVKASDITSNFLFSLKRNCLIYNNVWFNQREK